MKVAVIRYNAGNTGSVRNALQRLGIDPIVTADAETIASADKVIFPGVGEAASAMKSLREHGLDRLIPGLKQPVLGICLGMQLLCERSEERSTKCLGIVPASVKKFDDISLKVPHMGWNRVTGLEGEIFEGIEEGAYAYFVHGYYVELSPHTAAVCDYGRTFSAALRRGNFFATQFHPEKSGPGGERMLMNFLNSGAKI